MVFKKLTYSIKGSPTNEKMKKKKVNYYGLVTFEGEKLMHMYERGNLSRRNRKKNGRGSKVDSKILKLNLCCCCIQNQLSQCLSPIILQ